jgi:hypothetical protein
VDWIFIALNGRRKQENTADWMGAVLRCIQSDATDPFREQARVLTGGQKMPITALAIKNIVAMPLPCWQQVCIDGLSYLLGDLEFRWTTSLTLTNGSSINGVSLRRDIFNFQAHHIPSTLFHAEAGRELYDPDEHKQQIDAFGGHDAGVCCRLTIGMLYSIQGRLDEGRDAAGGAVMATAWRRHIRSRVYDEHTFAVWQPPYTGWR